MPYLLVEALADQGRGDYKLAATKFQRLIEVASVREAALAGLVSSYSQLGDNQQAVETLKDIIDSNPSDITAIALLAKEMKIGKRSQQELKEFWSKHLSANADWAAGHIEFGNLLSSYGDHKSAYAAYAKSFELQNQNSTKLLMAFAKEQMGDTSAATTLYRELLATVPGSLLVRNNLSMLLSANKDSLNEALEIAEPLAATDQPFYLDTIGWLHALGGDQSKAVELLNQAVELAPDTGELRYHLGFARYQLQQIDEARKEITRALEKSAQTQTTEEWRRDAENLLQQM